MSEVEQEATQRLSPPALKRWQRAQDRLREMGAGLERIRELVIKLRTFSRMDEGTQKSVSMRESVESLLMMLTHRTKDRIEVETQFGEPDVVECYPSLMNQAVMNLLTNSIDAIEDAGKITITTGADADVYRISVADTGTGIPPEVRERVLEPFFTTKAVGEGTGLGLSITYSIVRRHGGALELSEAKGGGTRAVITIPLTASDD
jgi:two-component system NtrC family sensor kinase